MALDGPFRTVPLTLYTEQLVVRGAIQTRQHRVTDILNDADGPFLVLEDVSLEELGSRGEPTRTEYAQVNLGAILFAVSLQAVEPVSELRTPRISQRAIVSIPPFRVVGLVHLQPHRSLRDALGGPHASFVPVTDAIFWSDRPGGGRQSAAMVAVNQARAQVIAPYRDAGPAAGEEPGVFRAGPGVSAAPTRLPGLADDPGSRPPGSF
jgi:hypothetical protein